MSKEAALNKTSSTSKKFGTTTRSLRKTLKTPDYSLQQNPPLSIQQYIGSSVGKVNGSKQWVPGGKFHPKAFHEYLSPALRDEDKDSPAAWKDNEPHQEKAQTALSSQMSPNGKITTRVWNPPSRITHRPVAYFDPPSLRWSLKDLRRTVQGNGSSTMYSSRN